MDVFSSSRFVFLLVAVLLPAHSQQAARPAGVPPEWEARKMLDGLVATAKRIPPVLDQVDTAHWNGAPEQYAGQLISARSAVGYLEWSASRLSKKPSSMPAGLDLFLRMQTAESLLESLAGGIRKYQSAELADGLLAITNETAVQRDVLRLYLLDLATQQEAEMKLMDNEAQRCRGILSALPAPPKAGAKK